MTKRTASNAVRLLIVGPPGAGKGTQAVGIAEAYGIPAVSTGDIFRSNIKQRTDLGLRVQSIIEAGDLVPDSLTNELVEDRLNNSDVEGGFLLDGYPRSVGQVEFLRELLQGQGTQLDAVIELAADTDVVVERLRRRAFEQGRADDTEEAIRHRQHVYVEETAPVLSIYRALDRVVTVDGMGSVEEVRERILGALEQRGIHA